MNHARRSRAWLPVATVAATLALTLVTAVVLSNAGAERDRLRFERYVDEGEVRLQTRLDTYVALLRGGTGFVAAGGVPSRAGWFSFADRLEIQENYPGIQGVGWSMVVGDDVEAFEAGWQARGLAGFETWPDDPGTAIVHLYPLDRRNQAAIGFDMSSEPTRREAMARSRDQAQPAASGRVVLVQEIDPEKQAGFLIYLPVYATEQPPETVEARREALVGWVYSPFRAGDLLEAVVGEQSPLLDLAAYDGRGTDSDALLYRTGAPVGVGERVGNELSDVRTIDVYGRPWTLVFRSNERFRGVAEVDPVPAVVLIGLLFSLALFVATRSQHRARAAAEGIAERLSRSEAALRIAKEAAEEANRTKDDFLATVSHELRTPLNAMLGWTQMLRAGRLSDAQRDDALAIVERNAQAQARLVEDLLDISRILRGKLDLELSRVVVTDVIEGARTALAPAAATRDITIEVDVTPGLSAILADPTRLQQVVWNLLSNAIKFTDPGGRVRIEVAPVGDDLEIAVSDTGRGIAPEFLPYVFERFRQADPSTRRDVGGLGLGLGIVRQLVEMHGGTVHAESDGVGKGARFVVRIPRRSPAPVEPVEAPPTEIRLDDVKVLVVDDEADARALLTYVLGSAGAEVHEAASAQEGFEAVRALRPDVLVSDIGMPGEDGWSLMERIRALPASDDGDVPALALTAFARSEDVERSLRVGFEDHLSKPVDPQELLVAVARLAGRARG